MSEGFSIKRKDDGRVLVVILSSCEITKEEITALLVDAGVNEASIEFVEADKLADNGILTDDTILIPLDALSSVDPLLEDICRNSATTGATVIGVCNSTVEDERISVFDSYGTQIDWTPASVAGCFNPEIPNPIKSPKGDTLTPVKGKQVNC